eukprot:3818467-Rhodomonas_salina.5
MLHVRGVILLGEHRWFQMVRDGLVWAWEDGGQRVDRCQAGVCKTGTGIADTRIGVLVFILVSSLVEPELGCLVFFVLSLGSVGMLGQSRLTPRLMRLGSCACCPVFPSSTRNA